MPDEFDFKNYKTIKEFEKTIEGTNYLHSLYLRAINSPVRREILNYVNDAQKISRDKLLKTLKDNKIINDEPSFDYHMDYLIKAFCVKRIEKENKIYYEITQSGQVIDYLK
ncbi:MAG: hypothetical protein ACFFHD_06845 [Promethearchaeota archaeon]